MSGAQENGADFLFFFFAIQDSDIIIMSTILPINTFYDF